MTEIGLGIIVALLVLTIIVEIVQYRRTVTLDRPRLYQALESVEKSCQALESSVRNELAAQREASATAARQSREELGKVFADTANALEKNVDQIRATVEQRLKRAHDDSTQRFDQFREGQLADTKVLREEIANALKEFKEMAASSTAELGKLQQTRLDALVTGFKDLANTIDQKLDEAKSAMARNVQGIQQDTAKQIEQSRTALDVKLQETDKRLGDSLRQLSDQMEQLGKHVRQLTVPKK